MVRKITSLYTEKYGENAGKLCIHFAYYELDSETERLEFNGLSEECYITEDQFYNLIKPVLIQQRRPTRREIYNQTEGG